MSVQDGDRDAPDAGLGRREQVGTSMPNLVVTRWCDPQEKYEVNRR
jgi:hypothetical protein